MKNLFRDGLVSVAASGLLLCGLCLGFDTKAGAQGIELSIDGLAKELSEQAKMLGNVSLGLGNLTKRVAQGEDRVELLEKKVAHIVAILKLQKENAAK